MKDALERTIREQLAKVEISVCHHWIERTGMTPADECHRKVVDEAVAAILAALAACKEKP